MQGKSVSSQQLADALQAFMVLIMKSHQREVFALADELGLSMTQLKSLFILDGSDDELTPSELAKLIGLSPAAVGRAVDALVRQGILSRREDETDRRVKRLALTDDGRHALGRIAQARREGLARLVTPLDPAQRVALSDALRPLLPHPSDPCASHTEDPA